MFSKYWRSYPWWLQMVLFGLMVFIFISLSQLVALLIIPKITGVPLSDIADENKRSSLPVVKSMFILQAISAIGLFLLPSLLFANLAHPRPVRYLGLVKPGKAIQPLLAIIAMVAATPVFLFIATLVKMIGLGPYADSLQEQNDEMVKIFLNAAPQIGLGVVLLVMSVLPAIAEEIFFRGILMRFIKKRSYRMVGPIAISAMAFALAHATPYSFLAIFFAGVALAIIYNLTGSLWCSMLAHMFYNGAQVALDYFGKDNATVKGIMESNTVPIPMLIGGAIISAIAFYLLWKFRTPLPPNWADDYTQEELSQKAV